MRILPILLAALLSGCATTLVRETPKPVRVAPGVSIGTVRLAEELLALKCTRVQAANGEWRDRAFSAQCVLKGDGERLTAVFLAPHLRLLTITLTKPHAVECERAPQVPRAFEPEYALFDLACVNLDTTSLRRAVSPALRVDDDGTTRRVFAGGTLVTEVVRKTDGDVLFSNKIHDYRYTLRSVAH